jgi:hypothetical protein
MFKKTLLAGAALSALVIGASTAQAGYGYSFGYGHNHHHNDFLNYSYNDYSDYSPSCYYESRPVTIKLWDDYSYSYYFKTIYRQVKVCY